MGKLKKTTKQVTTKISAAKNKRNLKKIVSKNIAQFLGMAIIVASLALCLSCIGKELMPPFQSAKTWKSPTTAASNSHTNDPTKISDVSNLDNQYSNCAYVVVDDSGLTLNILSKDFKLFTQNAISGTKFNVDKICRVALYGNNVYMSVITWSEDKTHIESEHIIRTNIYGECQEVLYEVAQNQPTNYEFADLYKDAFNKTPAILDLKVFDNNLSFCEFNYNTAQVKTIPLTNEGTWQDEPQTKATYTIPYYLTAASYDPSQNVLLLMDMGCKVYKCSENVTPSEIAIQPTNLELQDKSIESLQDIFATSSGTSNNVADVAVCDGYTVNVNLTSNNKILALHNAQKPVQFVDESGYHDIDSSVTIIGSGGSDGAKTNQPANNAGSQNNTSSQNSQSDSASSNSQASSSSQNSQTSTTNQPANSTDSAAPTLTWGEVLLDGYGNALNIGSSIPIHWYNNLKIHARWAAFLVLIIALILAIIYLVRSQIKLVRKGLFQEVTVAILIGVTALAVCGFYSLSILTTSFDNAQTQTKQQADIACNSVTQDQIQGLLSMQNVLDNLTDGKAISVQDIESALKTDSIDKMSQQLVDEFSVNSLVYYYSYFGKNKDSGEIERITTSQKATPTTQDISSLVNSDTDKEILHMQLLDNEQALREGQTVSFVEDDSRGEFICSAKALKDANNQIAAVAVFAIYCDNVLEMALVDIIALAFVVLIIYLIFLVAYLEIRRMSICIRNYRADKNALKLLEGVEPASSPTAIKKANFKTTRAFVNLIRPLNFFIALAFGADGALAVLVSKKLFDASTFAEGAANLGLTETMYSLPIAMTCAGLVIGIMLFTRLQKRLSIRLIFIPSSIMFALSFLLGMGACLASAYVLFVVAKIFIGLFCGIMKAELYTFTTLKEAEDDRKELLRDISRSAMPAVVVSTLLCGYLATFVDYYVLYLFAGIVSLAIIILGVIFVPAKLKLCADGTKFSLVRRMNFYSRRTIVRWIFSPQVLLVIFFVIVPCAITKGYKSYLFPLYSSSVGMDKATISIIYSMATMVSFLMVYVISDYNNRFKDSRKAINALFVLGFVFVLFRANIRIEWAVVAMFITCIFSRTFGSAFRLGLTRICQQNGLEKAQILPYIYLIEEVCNALQVVLCGLLTTVGGKYACAIFGVYCLVSAVVFAICVRRTHFDTKID